MPSPLALLVLVALALATGGCGAEDRPAGVGGPTGSTAAPGAAAQTTTSAPGLVEPLIFRTVRPADAAVAVDAGATLVDVREQDEWDAGHAPGAVHIPLGELRDRLGELSRRSPGGDVVFVCRSGRRATTAAEIALDGDASLGDVIVVDGGMRAWVAAGLPLEPAGGTVL